MSEWRRSKDASQPSIKLFNLGLRFIRWRFHEKLQTIFTLYRTINININQAWADSARRGLHTKHSESKSFRIVPIEGAKVIYSIFVHFFNVLEIFSHLKKFEIESWFRLVFFSDKLKLKLIQTKIQSGNVYFAIKKTRYRVRAY